MKHFRDPTGALALALVMAAGLTLGGCAAMHRVDSDVSSYTQWPAERKPASYSFERLPSQEAQAQRQSEIENAAREALTQAGFTEAPDAATSDVTVQLGARVSRQDRSPWDDPFWWHGGFFYGRGWWGGPSFAWRYDNPRYEREVAVLIRDRKTGQPLYESHASNDGFTPGDNSFLAAMFSAAMKDFPLPALNPRRVSIPLARQ